MLRQTKTWILIIAVFAAVMAVLSYTINRPAETRTIALLVQDGHTLREIDLSEVRTPYTITLDWEDGQNIIEVEPGRIRVTDADCPDKVCVNRGWLSADSPAPIVCLPHHLEIRLQSSSSHDIDAVAQ